ASQNSLSTLANATTQIPGMNSGDHTPALSNLGIPLTELDMKPDEVDILYKMYSRMTGRVKLNEIYDKLGDNIFSLIGLHRRTEREGTGPRQVVNGLKIAEELPDLEAKYQVINDNIEWAERGMFQVNKPKAREISTRR